MPQIGAFIGGIVSAVGAQTIVGAVLRFAISAAVSAAISRAMRPDGPGIGARTITQRGTINPQTIIYGTAVLGGTLAYRNTHGAKNAQLWAVHLLAGHECHAITDAWLDSRIIVEADINSGAAAGGDVGGTGFYKQQSGRDSTVEIWKHLGTSTQTVNSALDSVSTDWTSAHRLRGITYAVTKFYLVDRTEDVWEAGDPTNVKFKVHGKKLYDPRLDSTRVIDSSTSPVTLGSGAHRVTDSTTWAWVNTAVSPENIIGDNPALCVADFLMDSKFSPFEGEIGPGGIDPTRIDWESVATAADDCDTLVSIPLNPAVSPITTTTEKRFTCNGVLYGTDSPENNLEAILSSMNGSLDFSGGKYIVRAGVYKAPVDSLDEDDIIGPIGVASALDSEERINTIKARYVDEDKEYEPTETAAITFAAYKDTRDGGNELIRSIELPMTNSWYEAQRICQKQLQMANEELVITVPCNLRAARLVPGERVNLTITERGWTPKIFKVLDWELFDKGGQEVGVNVTLREDDSSAYADPAAIEYNTATNGTITEAAPTPIPGVDSIPRGIRYGEGSWTIELTKNFDSSTSPSANDGEVLFSAGRFTLPDGTVRTLSSPAHVLTPYEAAVTPPDGRFYLIWGASSVVGRFSPSPTTDLWGSAGTIFTATYDRIHEQWYAVENGNTDYAFTPADTDYVVATGTKTSASGGIDSLTSLVAATELPPLSNLLPADYSDFETWRNGPNNTITGPGTYKNQVEGGDWSVDTTRAFTGTQSILLSPNGTPTNSCQLGKAPWTNNVFFKEDARLMVYVRVWPDSVSTPGADYFEIFGGPVASTQHLLSSLNAGAWNELRFELDFNADPDTFAVISLVYTVATGIPSPQNSIWWDAVEVLDVTDFPEITEGIN